MSATTFVRMPSAKQMAVMGIPDLPEAAFGGDLPPLQRKVLVQAMGMTLHKGGGLKAVIGVVAAIAIPFAAPVIAGSIATSMGVTAATFGLSSTVGSVLGSAIVGAGLGAVNAAVTGQNIGRGALFGAIGGGIGGYTTAPTTPAPATGTGLTLPPVSGATAPVATGAGGLTGTGSTIATGAPGANFGPVDYSLTGGQSFTNIGLRAPTGAADLGSTLSSSGVGLNPNAAYGVGLQVPGAAAPSLGVGISQFPAAAGTGQYASTSWTPPDYSLTGTSTASAGGSGVGLKAPTGGYALYGGDAATTAGTSTVSGYGLKAPASTNVFGSGFGGSTAGGTTTAGSATASVWGKFSDALKAKFADPKAQADMVLRAAGQLAGSAIAGDGLSDEEKQLLEQQRAELEQLRVTNQELFNQRLQAAQDLLGESRYFDPEYFGGQSYKAYQTAAARAERDVLRGIGPQRAGLRTAEQRRFALQRSAGGQTAYLQGADMAEQNRIRNTQAGINALPTSGPTTALSYGNYIGQLYDAVDRRRRQTAGDIGDLFGTFTGTSMANKL